MFITFKHNLFKLQDLHNMFKSTQSHAFFIQNNIADELRSFDQLFVYSVLVYVEGL